MFAPPRSVVRALVLAGFVFCLTSSTSAHAQSGTSGTPGEASGEVSGEASSEAIDDPKVERRLGARVDFGPVVPLDASAQAPSFADAGVSPSETGADVVAQPQPSEPAGMARYVPHVKLGYRLLPFVQIGPTGLGQGADETFHVVSLDLYPVSTKWRFGVSPQYGWENGTFRKNGDAFLALSLAIGGQIPGPTFTPFFEVFLGGGFMQRMHHQGVLSTPATAFAQWGIDVGSELFLARYAFLSFSIGWLHGLNYWVKTAEKSGLGTPQHMSVDTWSLKLGFGI